MDIYNRNRKEKVVDFYYDSINTLRYIKFFFEKIFKNKHFFLKKNLELKNLHAGNRCFVIGNGPSINDQDLEILSSEIVFMVNRAFLDPRYHIILPKYHVIVDPKLSSGEWPITFLDEIAKKNPQVTFLLNSSWYDLDIFQKYIQKYKIYWIDGSLTITPRFFHKKIDLTKRTFSNAVVEYGIVSAIYMGMKEINFLGVDGNGLCYSLLGRTDSHSYGHNPEDLTMNYKNIIRALDSMSGSLRKWFHIYEYCKINNLTKGGILNFNKVNYDDYINLQAIDK